MKNQHKNQNKNNNRVIGLMVFPFNNFYKKKKNSLFLLCGAFLFYFIFLVQDIYAIESMPLNSFKDLGPDYTLTPKTPADKGDPVPFYLLVTFDRLLRIFYSQEDLVTLYKLIEENVLKGQNFKMLQDIIKWQYAPSVINGKYYGMKMECYVENYILFEDTYGMFTVPQLVIPDDKYYRFDGDIPIFTIQKSLSFRQKAIITGCFALTQFACEAINQNTSLPYGLSYIFWFIDTWNFFDHFNNILSKSYGGWDPYYSPIPLYYHEPLVKVNPDPAQFSPNIYKEMAHYSSERTRLIVIAVGVVFLGYGLYTGQFKFC